MNFRDTGQKDSGNVISRDSAYLSANDGLLIPACNADKSIIVYDVLSYGAGTLGTAADGGGTRLGFINAGHNEYGASLIVPAGQGVYTNAQSGNITITYAVVDGLPASRITNVSSGGGGATTTTAAPTTTTAAPTTTTAAPTTTTAAPTTTTTTAAPTTTTTTTTTAAPTTTTAAPTTTTAAPTTTTTTAAPGNLTQVTNCAGGTVLIDDYNGMAMGSLSVGDILAWSEGAAGGGGDYHCGTVAAVDQSGTSTGSIDMTSFTDCAECNMYYGL